MSTPIVSVLIDTYNHERFIEEALASVLGQDYPAGDREVLVVDDGSTDRTPELLRKFEPHVRVLRKPNGGQASAFNLGIQQCRGDVVAFLDADDWWAPGKLSRVVATMREEPDVGFVGHGIVTVTAEGAHTAEVLREGFRFQANTRDGAALFRRRGSFMGTSRMAVRRSLLDKIGWVPEEIRIQADEYIYTLAAALAPMRILPEALTYYRIHADNGFIISNHSPERLRNKLRSLVALRRTLSAQLALLGIEPELREFILAYTTASAEQLRLTLDGGWPWETAAVEWRMDQVAHPDAGLRHRLFKALALTPALLVGPKRFYSLRNNVAQSPLYRRLRERLFPFVTMKHIARTD